MDAVTKPICLCCLRFSCAAGILSTGDDKSNIITSTNPLASIGLSATLLTLCVLQRVIDKTRMSHTLAV
jgi:hypothetical protein